MQAILKLEKVWSTIEHPHTLPTVPTGQDAQQVQAEKRDTACSLLLLSVDVNIMPLIEEITTPKEIWDELKKQYAEATSALKVTLLRKLSQIKLEDCENLEQYFCKYISVHH